MYNIYFMAFGVLSKKGHGFCRLFCLPFAESNEKENEPDTQIVFERQKGIWQTHAIQGTTLTKTPNESIRAYDTTFGCNFGIFCSYL